MWLLLNFKFRKMIEQLQKILSKNKNNLDHVKVFIIKEFRKAAKDSKDNNEISID